MMVGKKTFKKTIVKSLTKLLGVGILYQHLNFGRGAKEGEKDVYSKSW